MNAKKHAGRMIVFDTTLRDGEQAPGCHLSPRQKLKIARRLARLGVDVIEAGFPVSSPAEFEAVRAIARTVGREEDAPEICGLARSVPADIRAAWDAVRPARRPRIHLFLASSDIHLKHKLKMTRAESIRRAVEAVRHARGFTPNVQFAAEDASRADRGHLFRLVEAVIDARAATVNIPDTVGYATPEEFAGLIREMRRRVPNIGRAVISVHCHDDLGLAAANTLAAVQAGARQVECTLNGIGERAGNCALEEVVMAVRTRRDRYPVRTRIRTEEIVPASRDLARATGMRVAANKAVVGANAFAHGSGVHQDGMLKNRVTYEIMKPEDVGAGETRIVLTARSGRMALADRFRKMGVSLSDGQVQSLFPRFKQIADRRKWVNDRDLRTLLAAGY